MRSSGHGTLAHDYPLSGLQTAKKKRELFSGLQLIVWNKVVGGKRV
jgi:hypothetical protein